MENKRNYYRILHVQFDAPPSVISASYRTIMQKLRMHPDLGGEEWNACLINEARDVLINPQLRAEYDQQLIAAGNLPGRGSYQMCNQSTIGGRPNWDPVDSKGATHSDGPPLDTQPESVEDLLFFEPRQQCQFCRHPVIRAQATLVGYTSTYRCTRCDAPLETVKNYRAVQGNDLREIHRSSLEQNATVWKSWPRDSGYDALVCDWSTAGCCIEMRNSIDIDSVILLQSPSFNAIATVRYRSDDLTEKQFIGLEFLTLEVTMDSGSFLNSCT